MASNDATARKAFLAGLQVARDRPPSLMNALWTGRWAFIQWLIVIAVFAAAYGQLFGPDHVSSVVSLGIGLLLGLFLSVRNAIRTWLWLSSVIDWAKVERELSGSPEARE